MVVWNFGKSMEGREIRESLALLAYGDYYDWKLGIYRMVC